MVNLGCFFIDVFVDFEEEEYEFEGEEYVEEGENYEEWMFLLFLVCCLFLGIFCKMWKRGMRERDILVKNGYNDRIFWNYGYVFFGMLKLLMLMN